MSHHDWFESCRSCRVVAVDSAHIGSPDVEIQTILTDRVLGVPHIGADEVSVRVVYWLHTRVANVICLVRICHTYTPSESALTEPCVRQQCVGALTTAATTTVLWTFPAQPGQCSSMLVRRC